MAGGQKLVLTGSGFSNMTLHGMATEVRICGIPCHVRSVTSSTSLTCTTGPYTAIDTKIEDHYVLPVFPTQVAGTGTAYEQVHYEVGNLFDQKLSTSWRFDLYSCANMQPHPYKALLRFSLYNAAVAFRSKRCQCDLAQSGRHRSHAYAPQEFSHTCMAHEITVATCYSESSG
jgi:hypothetical protein